MKLHVTVALLFAAFTASAQVTFPINGPHDEHSPATVYDGAGNLYVAGVFQDATLSGSADFDPGLNDEGINSPDAEAVFLASYDTFGRFKWVRQIASYAEPSYDVGEDADLTLYDDGWQNTDAAVGFTNWFDLEVSGTSKGRRELITNSPLEGERSWQIMCSNSFYGVGKRLSPVMGHGRISVMVRHDYEPTGGFNGFNLSSSLTSGSFGDFGTEHLSCSMNSTSAITVQANFLGGTSHVMSPTLDGDLRGDLLEYVIDVNTNGNWKVRIINHSEPGAPTPMTNTTILSSAPVRTIRFGSFIGDTNGFLGFDSIRMLYGEAVSATGPFSLSPRTPDGVWVHGSFTEEIIAYGETNAVAFDAQGGENGYAFLFSANGNVIDSVQAVSTSAPGDSAISAVLDDAVHARQFIGTVEGTLNPTSFFPVVSPSNTPAAWWSPIAGSGSISFAQLLLPDSEAYGIYGVAGRGDSKTTVLATYDDDIRLMLQIPSPVDFDFGGPGVESTCYDCLEWDDDWRLYFGGNFEQTVTFTNYDEIAASYISTSITSVSSSDIFLACYLNDFSELGWVAPIGGADINDLTGINLDRDTNIVITGIFAGTMDMDGDAGSATLSSVATNGGIEGFVAQYDRDGGFNWAYRIGAATANSETVTVSCTTLDPLGRITVAGTFPTNLSAQLPNTVFNLANAGERDIYVLQLESDGSLAGPPLTGIAPDPTNTMISVETRAGITLRIEALTESGAWSNASMYVQVSTGAANFGVNSTIYSNAQFRALTEW